MANGFSGDSLTFGSTNWDTSNRSWGVTTGTTAFCIGAPNGSDADFRYNCPNDGQMSLKVDGRFYQNEGQYQCIDTSGGTLSGSLTAPGYYVSSSRDKKKKIKPTEVEPFEILDKIKVVDFYYKTDKNCDTPKIGFIAEDTPELLTGKNHDSMDQANCIGVLIKAVQELNKRLTELESSVR